MTDKRPMYSVPCDEHLHEELSMYAPPLAMSITVTVINFHNAKQGSVAEIYRCRCGKPSQWMISNVVIPKRHNDG